MEKRDFSKFNANVLSRREAKLLTGGNITCCWGNTNCVDCGAGARCDYYLVDKKACCSGTTTCTSQNS